LEGRVTVHPEQNAGNRRGRGRGGGRNQARHVTKTDGELKISVKVGDSLNVNQSHCRLPSTRSFSGKLQHTQAPTKYATECEIFFE
uniref:ZP domain-containing protein n=1 Tax=Haemonchus placei TaxID=6290 RepID=A0A0N4VWA6_HAEPC